MSGRKKVRLLSKVKDGGPESPVTAYFLIECKRLFSIGLLHFPRGSRENFHNHAFDSISFVLSGHINEELTLARFGNDYRTGSVIRTFKHTLHRVWGIAKSTWVLTFRGPWDREWQEYDPRAKTYITYQWGRKVVAQEKGDAK